MLLPATADCSRSDPTRSVCVLVPDWPCSNDVAPTVVNEMLHHVCRVLGSGVVDEEDDGDDSGSVRSSGTTVTTSSLVSALDDEGGTSSNVATIVDDPDFALAIIRELKRSLEDYAQVRGCLVGRTVVAHSACN